MVCLKFDQTIINYNYSFYLLNKGTFTFVEQRLDIGNHKQLLKLKPFFTLSDKFAQTHLVEFEKEYVNTAIPVTRVNFSSIYELAKRKYSRDVIEVVINEAFIAIDHFLRSEGVITVPFNGLGVLRIGIQNPKPKKQALFEFSSAMMNHLPLC